MARPRLAAARPFLTAEGVAVAAVAWSLWHLAGRFGGVDVRDAVRGMAPLLLAVPAAVTGVRGLGRRWGWLVAAVCSGLVVSVVFASHRTDMVLPLVTYSAMLVAAPAVIAVWRTSWGPAALAAIVIAAGARSWWIGFEVWYGNSLNDAAIDRWLALPWHNQSGVLMAALAAGLGVAAATANGRWALVAGAGASSLAAAAKLSGSRGALVALGVGVVAGLGLAPRRWWRWAAMAAGASVIVVALTGLPGTAASDGGESLPAAESSSARLSHWRAGWQMFVDDPLTGHGIGSYRLVSPRWAPGDANPTAHAHNEFLELAAEGGIAVALPAAVLLIGALAAATRSLAIDGAARSRVAAAAAAAWLVLAAHAAIDFDWLFPMLAVLFAVVTGMVVGRQPRDVGLGWPGLAAGALLVGALVFGVVEGFGPRDGSVHPPWNGDAAAARAEQALATGDLDGARAISSAGAVWSPGDPRPGLWTAVAELRAGAGSPAAVVVAARRGGFGLRLDAVTQLMVAGHLTPAQQLLTDVIDSFDSYPGWNLGGAAAVAYRLQVDLSGMTAGCDAARHAADVAEATPLATSFGDERYADRAERYCS